MKWILVILIPLLQGCNTWQLPENLGSDLLSSFDPRIPYRGQGSIYDPHVHDYNPDRYYQDQNDNHLIDLSPAWYNKPSLAQQIWMDATRGPYRTHVKDPVTGKWRPVRNRIEALNGAP